MLESEWLSFESMIAPGGPTDNVDKNSYLVDGVVAYPGMKSAQKLSSSEAELAPVVQSSESSDSEDGNTLIVAEEVPLGLPMLTVDLTGVLDNDIQVIADFQFPNLVDENLGADEKPTPHNPYILGNKLVF